MIRIVVHSPPLTLAQVAHMAGVSYQRILVLARKGRIDGAFKLSGNWLFTSNYYIRPGKNNGGTVKRRASSLEEYKALPRAQPPAP